MIEKDNEIIKKYEDMPDLQKESLDTDTKDSLKFAGIGLCLVVIAGVTMGMLGYETPSIQDYKNNIIQNVKTLEDCDRLIQTDAILSRYESITEPTRKAVNDRMMELDC